MALTKSYWNHSGKYQELLKLVEKLIPVEGSVANPRKNPALERFRKAANCYYDLYNNGLCNRKAEFNRLFGIRSSDYIRSRDGRVMPMLYELVEPLVDEIIYAAAVEQGLVVREEELTEA